MNPSPLRPIAVFRPMPSPRPIRLGLGTTEPAALRHTANFVAAFGAGPGIGARIARRAIGFGNRLAAFGGHRGFVLPEMSLDLRHRVRRMQHGDVSGRLIARWPTWSAPPAIGIPARHEEFLGLPVLPETSAFAEMPGFAEAPGFVEATAFFPAFPAPEFAPGLLRPEASPLILHRPQVGRAARAASGLTAMRRMTAAGERPAEMVSIGDLAARVADQHAVPEMFAASDVSRALAESARGGERFFRQAQDRLFAGARDDGRARDDRTAAVKNSSVPAYVGGVGFPAAVAPQRGMTTQDDGRVAGAAGPLPVILSVAKDLSPREQLRRSEAARPNFTLDLLRHAMWRPEHQATGVRIGGRSTADQAAQVYATPDAGLPGSAETPQIARSMRVEPVTTTLASPLPPSTLPAPEAEWRRPSPAAVSPAGPWSTPTPVPLLPPFVAERIARAAWIDPSSIAAEVSLPPWEFAPGAPTLRARSRRETAVSAHGVTTRFQGGGDLLVPRPPLFGGSAGDQGAASSAPTTRRTFPVEARGARSPTEATAMELPMVVRRLSFGSDRAQRALAATVSPVWGPLGRQVVPTIPPSMQVAPVAAPLPLTGGAIRDVGRPMASTSPFFAAYAGTQAAPYAQVAGPVVYRSPLDDRAEPTVAQRAEAAEVMATSVGQPLPPMVRRSMERRLGMDLAAVRVHSGPSVMRAANLVGARAMARGADVFMPGGVADSPAAEGMPLLAHELTHVAQHMGRRVSPMATTPLTLARRASDEEHEAGRIERQFLDRFPSLPGLGSLPAGGLPKMPSLPNMPDLGSLKDAAMPLVRPAMGALQQPLQQAEQMAGSALGKAENAVGSILGMETPAAAAGPNPAQLAEQVYQLLERRLIVERERGGYRR